MSRHRDVRSMDIYDEYDGYDDVYGHSVEDEYGVSPSTVAQFTYAGRHHSSPHTSFVQSRKEDDIREETEGEDDTVADDSARSGWPKLDAQDEVKLRSCLDELQNVLGESFSERSMVCAVVQHNFDCEKAIDTLLNGTGSAVPVPSSGETAARAVAPVTFTLDDASSLAAAAAVTPLRAAAAGAVQPPSDSLARMAVRSPGPAASVGAAAREPTQTDDTRGSTELVSSSAAATPVATRELGRSGLMEDVRYGGGSSAALCSTPALQRIMATDSAADLSGRSSPSLSKSGSRARLERVDAKKEYEKRRATGKDLINLVVIGHVDAGKSTLMGHLLYKVGAVSQKQMHKYEQESRKIGKASFMYAWVLDETEEERARGVTMDVAQTSFETPTKTVNVLDAPGHKDFIPNMITGAAQADSALLVVNATSGEFETGFEAGGQTREHAMLAKSLGVSQLIVAVNKMDTVSWSEDRYNEIVKKLQAFLKQTAFREADVTYVPCSGLTGLNLAALPTNLKEFSWYKGECLLKEIEKLRPPERQIDKPFRLCVHDIFKGIGGGFSLAGQVEAGDVQPNDRILIMPAAEPAIVKTVLIDEAPVSCALAGDSVTLLVSGVDVNKIQIGNILCDVLKPTPTAMRIRARVVIFNIGVPITRGFPVVFHYQSMNEPASISRLVSQLNKGTGEVVKNNPRCLVKNTTGLIELEFQRPIAVELYKDYKELGRFMLRYGGSTIAAGVITEVSAQ